MQLTGANTLLDLNHGVYDGHTHVFLSDLPMVENRRYTPKHNATPESLADLLNRHRLQGALIVQPSFLGTDNSYLLSVLRDFQSSHLVFKGVVVLDPSSPPGSAELESMQSLGVAGVRLNLLLREEQFNYDRWQPLLSRTEELGWHVELHCRARYLDGILPVLVRNHAKVVIDHYGLIEYPHNDRGLSSLIQQPKDRVWIKISAPYRIHSDVECVDAIQLLQPLEKKLLKHFGYESLVWGSDWPHTQFETKVQYKELVPSDSFE